MFRTTASTASTASTARGRPRRRPFCKVCCDAGKPEHIYASHYVRLGTTVVCPTLLETVCSYCRARGHTKKYCEELKRNTNIKCVLAASASASASVDFPNLDLDFPALNVRPATVVSAPQLSKTYAATAASLTGIKLPVCKPPPRIVSTAPLQHITDGESDLASLASCDTTYDEDEDEDDNYADECWDVDVADEGMFQNMLM